MKYANNKTYTEAQFRELAVRLFGGDPMDWKFICPVCGNIQRTKDFEQYKDQGAKPNDAYQQCLGRYLPKDKRGGWSKDHSNPKVKRPCDFASFGLFRSPVSIVYDDEPEKKIPIFDLYGPHKNKGVKYNRKAV